MAISETHEAFRQMIPYDLVPTNLPGVFASPPPPGDFDLAGAASRSREVRPALAAAATG